MVIRTKLVNKLFSLFFRTLLFTIISISVYTLSLFLPFQDDALGILRVAIVAAVSKLSELGIYKAMKEMT